MNAMCRVILGVARQTDPLVVNFSVKLLVAFPEMKINDFFGFFKKSFLPSSWTFLHLYLCFTSYSLIITDVNLLIFSSCSIQLIQSQMNLPVLHLGSGDAIGEVEMQRLHRLDHLQLHVGDGLHRLDLVCLMDKNTVVQQRTVIHF